MMPRYNLALRFKTFFMLNSAEHEICQQLMKIKIVFINEIFGDKS